MQHGTALTVAGVMALIAAVMIAVGLVVDTQWNYALLFMGAFLLVIAVVVFATFTYQESVFRKVMREPLMELNVTGTDLDKMVQENSDAIRAQNLLSLIIMLFFLLHHYCGRIIPWSRRSYDEFNDVDHRIDYFACSLHYNQVSHFQN